MMQQWQIIRSYLQVFPKEIPFEVSDEANRVPSSSELGVHVGRERPTT